MSQAMNLFAGRPWRIAAASMVLALGAAAVQVAQAMPHGGHGQGGMMMGGAKFERMFDGANVTAEQRTRIRDIMKAARDDMRPQHESQRALRQQMMQLFAQPTVDARAVDALRQQIAAGHDQASKRMTQAMLDASAVLSPEQRKQIVERMAQRRAMMERHRAERDAAERPTR